MVVQVEPEVPQVLLVLAEPELVVPVVQELAATVVLAVTAELGGVQH
jgi:hypothetical protein